MEKYKILGYGAGDVPLVGGVEMAITHDEAYAENIVRSLANWHKGQWFGYCTIYDNGNQFFSKMTRVVEQTYS